MRYRGVSYGLAGPTVCEIVITDGRARTKRGLRIGDSWERARKLYPDFVCAEAHITGEHPRDDFRFCTGRTRPGLYAWFGGDPVDLIDIGRGRFPLTGVDR
jgi:hypothetical protein